MGHACHRYIFFQLYNLGEIAQVFGLDKIISLRNWHLRF